MLVVGIASPKQGGKDTVTNIVFDRLMSTLISTTIYRFADPIKDIVATFFSWDRGKLDNDFNYKEMVDPEWDLSPRQAMEMIGTEMFREGPLSTHFGIDPWTIFMKKRIETFKEQRKNSGLHLPFAILIPDVRHHVEMEMIKEFGGWNVFVDPRPRIEPDPDPHDSEVDMWEVENDEWDVIIPSGGPMEDTKQGARDLADKIQAQLIKDLKEGGYDV